MKKVLTTLAIAAIAVGLFAPALLAPAAALSQEPDARPKHNFFPPRPHLYLPEMEVAPNRNFAPMIAMSNVLLLGRAHA